MTASGNDHPQKPTGGAIIALASNLCLLLFLCLPWMQIVDKISGWQLAMKGAHEVLDKSPTRVDVEDMITALRFLAFLVLPIVGSILSVVVLSLPHARNGRSSPLEVAMMLLAFGLMALRVHLAANVHLQVLLPAFWLSFACDVGAIVGSRLSSRRPTPPQSLTGSTPVFAFATQQKPPVRPLQSQPVSVAAENGDKTLIKSPDSVLADSLRGLGVITILVGGGVALYVLNQATRPGLFNSGGSIDGGDLLFAGTVFFGFLVAGLATYGVGEVLQQVLNALQMLDHQAKSTTANPMSPRIESGNRSA